MMLFRNWVAGFLFLIMQPVVLLSASPSAQASEEAAHPEGDFSYEVMISGTDLVDISALLEQSSGLFQLQDRAPASLSALRRRADADEAAFRKVLRSEGYYASKVIAEIDTSHIPIQVSLSIEPGPIFTISLFDVSFVEGRVVPDPIDHVLLDIKTGQPARAESVVNARKKAIELLRNRGFPDAKLESQEVLADYSARQLQVNLKLDPGRFVRMGDLELKGLEKVKADYLYRLSGWIEGRPYSQVALDRTRRLFLDTGLFESVRYIVERTNGDQSNVPIAFTFVERQHRSIGVGADFSTSEGPGTSLFWENRNYLGRGERLRADLHLSQLNRELSSSFVKPHFLRQNQNLKTKANLVHSNTDAFKEDAARVTIGLDRRWRKNWSLGAGVFFEYSRVEENGKEETYAFLGMPLTASVDSTNDLLDPSSGYRLSTTMTPHLGLNEDSAEFLSAELQGSTYFEVIEAKRLILAARGKIGSIIGASRSELPAVKRLYSGGGGSVRGYEFQRIGPADADGDPSGGRSVIEMGLEARFRVSDTIGLVPFVEGGNVYEKMGPDFSEELQWAVGLGGRYYTSFGPLRFDIAVPVNGREGRDDAFQFYISIGQAF